MAYNDFVQSITNAIKDALTLDDVVNGEPNTQAKSRLGRLIYSLSTINYRVDVATTQVNQKLTDLNNAINTAAAAAAGEKGWTALLVKDAGGLTQQQINDYNHVKSPEMSGAKGMAVNDQAVFTNLSANHIYALAKEYTVPVWRSPAKTVIGNNTKINVDSVNGDTTVAVQIPSDANYSNVDFVNRANADIAWSYATIGNNTTLNNVGFYNFRDTVTNNSWGVLLDSRSNIVFNSPKFGNNGLADIAITDNVKNITINNATNTIDNGVYLDIEPNGVGNIENIKVDGGHYRKISVLPNSNQSIGIDNLNITNANVDELEIRGGRVRVVSSKVKKIKGNWSSLDYAGLRSEGLADLEINCVNLSKNMILDEFVNDFDASNESYWVGYSETTASIVRLNDNGYYTALNNSKTSYNQLTTRDFIELNGVKTIAVIMSYSVNNSVDTLMFEPILVDFYGANGNFIAPEYSVKGGQTLPGIDFDWSTGTAIFDVPQNATKFKIALRSNKAKSTLNVRKIGVYGVTMTDGDGNFNSELHGYKKLNVTKNLKVKQVLSYSIDANAVKATDIMVAGAKIGDNVQVSTTSSLGASSRIWAEITGDNAVTIYHQNLTANPLTVNTTANITIQ